MIAETATLQTEGLWCCGSRESTLDWTRRLVPGDRVALTNCPACCFARGMFFRGRFAVISIPVLACLCLRGVSLFSAETGVAPAGALFRTCAEVRSVSSDQLAGAPGADLEATVTFAEAGANLLFVQDGTAGIYVHGSQPLGALQAGSRVRVRGTVQAGLYAPVVFAEAVEELGQGRFPEAEVTTVSRVNAGSFDSQWVELSGIVRRDGPSWFHRVLELHDGGDPVYVRIKNQAELAVTNLVDARIVVRGVVANHISEATRPPGFTLYVPGPEHLRIETPPVVDPFGVRLVGIDRLAAWPGPERQGHLVRVKGAVTFQVPGLWLALQDEKTSAIIESSLTNRVEQGTEIEAVGFVAKVGKHARLVEALWRPTGSSRIQVPVRDVVDWSDLTKIVPGELLTVGGVLRGIAGREAVLQGDDALLPVLVRDDAPKDWEVGAEYRLTGVMLAGNTNLPAVGRSLWVTNANAARLVRGAAPAPAGWATLRDFLWLALFAAVVAGWWWEHRRQRIMLDEMEATLAFNRAQLARAEHEQARIARDLHDGVIQSIYSVGMRIEECRRLANTAPQTASEKLASTSEVLNHVIRDVRGFLTGLEPASIQGRELKTALKSVVLGLGDEAADRITLEIDRAVADDLTSKDATELFHVCKEAISNSLRHGHATRVVINLHRLEQGCHLEVTDNGTGFDPAQVSVDSRGLQNIRTRAKNLRSQLQLVTAPGAGTRLLLILPDV